MAKNYHFCNHSAISCITVSASSVSFTLLFYVCVGKLATLSTTPLATPIPTVNSTPLPTTTDNGNGVNTTPTVIVPGLEDIYFYIIVGVCALIVSLMSVAVLVVCCVCFVAKKHRKRRGTWRSSVHNNGVCRYTHTRTHNWIKKLSGYLLFVKQFVFLSPIMFASSRLSQLQASADNAPPNQLAFLHCTYN